MVRSDFKFQHFFLKLVFFIPFLILFYILCILYLNDYQSFVDYILQIADKNDQRLLIQQKFLTEHVFLIGRGLIIGIIFLYLLFYYYIFIKIDSIVSRLQKVFLTSCLIFKNYFFSNKREGLIFWTFIFLFIVKSVFFFEFYELQYDEAWTYLHFSSKGLIISAFSPNNNHIFYSLFAACFDFFPIPSKWVIRLPALISILTTLLIAFSFLKYHFGFRIAMITSLILASTCPFHFFSILGRAYGFVILFSMLSMIAVLGISTRSKNIQLHYYLLVVASLLGLYSCPSYFYVFAGNFIFLIFVNAHSLVQLKKILFCHIVIFLCIILLYFPALICGSAEILGTAASESKGSSFQFFHYLNRLYDWLLFGKDWPVFSGIIIVVISFIILSILFKTNKIQSKLFSYSAWMLSLPFLFFILTNMQVPYRIWCFESVFISIGLGLGFGFLFKNKFIYTFCGLILFSVNIFFSFGHYFMNWSAGLDREAKQISKIMLTYEIPPANCYFFSRYDKPLIEYYYQINHKKLTTYMPFKESKNYRPFDNELYDAVLLDIEDYLPTESDLKIIRQNPYELIYENSRIKLYLLNKDK